MTWRQKMRVVWRRGRPTRRIIYRHVGRWSWKCLVVCLKVTMWCGLGLALLMWRVMVGSEQSFKLTQKRVG